MTPAEAVELMRQALKPKSKTFALDELEDEDDDPIVFPDEFSY
jgi:hypothetical protein